jgi:hypothetical protein
VKLNWGVGIAITIILFLIISFALIFHFMNQKVDLVTDNYYEKTLVYQNKIDEAERSKELYKQIKLEYSDNQLKFVFPDSVAKAMNDGEVYFYRPSNSNMDFKTPLQVNQNGELVLDASKIEKGYWKVHLKWLMNKDSYSVERTVMIN